MEYQEDYTGKNFKDIPTYKRMCICIIKNDHLCKYMGFRLRRVNWNVEKLLRKNIRTYEITRI